MAGTASTISRTPVAAILGALALFVSARADDSSDRAWTEMPEILKRIIPPVFPKKEFEIRHFGAAEGGTVNCGKAFADAIEACAKAGGGKVVVPAGKFLTGPIHLRSNVELHLAKGSEVIFSNRFGDYLPPVLVRVGGVEVYNYSPLIYAKDCTNVAVTGPGRLNGNSETWWEWKGKETKAHFEMGAKGVPLEKRVFGTPEAAIRPSFLCLMDCTNILLEGFTIGSGPNWTVHPVYCRNLTIRGVTVDTDGPNNDGIDPDSCRDVLIENCTFNTGDDCVVLKSGYNEDGWRVARPTENVIMRNCSSKQGHGGLVIGSEMSGDVRNVFMHDCHFEGTDRAIRIKSRRDRGGVVENVHTRDVTVRNMQHEVVILNMDYSADKNAPVTVKPPLFRNMSFERITGNGAPTAILIQGDADSPIENIRFTNMTITSTRGIVANHVQNLLFDNVRITPEKGPVFDLANASHVTIRNAKIASGTAEFLNISGKSSGGIVIEAEGAKPGISTTADVPPGAVSVQ